MGAPDRLFSKLIPKEKLGEATTWDFQSLAGAKHEPTGPEKILSDREKRAFERGRELGYQQGAAAVQQTRAQHAQQLERALNELRARFNQLESDGADAVLNLALEVARHVIRREIELQRDAVLPAVREAVMAVVDQQAHPRIFMNPHDLELVQADLDADGLFKGCRFIPDIRVARGGCRIETHHGEIDAQLKTRWRRVLATLGVDPKDANLKIED